MPFRLNLLAEHSDEDSPRPEVFEFVLPVNDPPYNNPGPSGFAIDRFNKPISSPSRFTRKIETYRADAQYDFGPVTLKSITGLRKRRATSDQDVDVFAASAIQRLLDATTNASETFKRFFQDVRLTSAADARFFWLVGAEYTKVDSRLPTTLNAVIPTIAPSECNAAIACTLAILQGAARNAYRNVLSGTDDRSYAAYAAATYKVTDRLSITADVRYTVDKKRFFSDEQRRLDNPATPVNEQLIQVVSQFQIRPPHYQCGHISQCENQSLYDVKRR